MSVNWKALVRGTFHKFGIEVHRLPAPPVSSGVVPVKIGPYRIMMDAKGTLHRTLTAYPDYSGELRRLVALAVTKYPDLAVIDVGANFGDTAAIAKLGADVPVFCIEGDPSAYRLLEQNIRQFRDVRARLALLGDKAEEVPVTLAKEGWNLTVVPQQQADGAGAGGASTVTLTTLDECVRDLPDADRYRVLKIDAEGFDCRIVRGGMRFIERVHPVIMLEYNRENMDAIGEPGIDTLMRLREAGYRDMLYFDTMGRLIAATTLDQVELIWDLHEYADGRAGQLYYVDLCLFHRDDRDLAAHFVRAERERRHGGPVEVPAHPAAVRTALNAA